MAAEVRRMDRVKARLERFPANFATYLDVFDERLPFRRPNQLSLHQRTLALRAEAGSAVDAARNPQFRRNLWDTLHAWGLGIRGSDMVTYAEFVDAVEGMAPSLVELEDLHIEDPALDTISVGKCVWKLIADTRIVTNHSILVSGTKALHHLLPNLVMPMDRAFTQRFYEWHNPEFQSKQEQFFMRVFGDMAAVARTVQPSRFVGAGWRTSPAKLLDNAVVGCCMQEGLAEPWGGTPPNT